MIDWPPAEMFLPCDNPDAAIRVGKKAWQGECIITGRTQGVHGCHWFDRGMPIYAHLKSLPLNIFPMVMEFHKPFDHCESNFKRYPVTMARTPNGDYASKRDWLLDVVKKHRRENLERVEFQLWLCNQVRMACAVMLDQNRLMKAKDALAQACETVIKEVSDV